MDSISLFNLLNLYLIVGLLCIFYFKYILLLIIIIIIVIIILKFTCRLTLDHFNRHHSDPTQVYCDTSVTVNTTSYHMYIMKFHVCRGNLESLNMFIFCSHYWCPADFDWSFFGICNEQWLPLSWSSSWVEVMSRGQRIWEET